MLRKLKLVHAENRAHILTAVPFQSLTTLICSSQKVRFLFKPNQPFELIIIKTILFYFSMFRQMRKTLYFLHTFPSSLAAGAFLQGV